MEEVHINVTKNVLFAKMKNLVSYKRDMLMEIIFAKCLSINVFILVDRMNVKIAAGFL